MAKWLAKLVAKACASQKRPINKAFVVTANVLALKLEGLNNTTDNTVAGLCDL